MEGMLVIADIGGYSRYLTGVELEHSQDILADIIGLIAEQLGKALTVEQLEGDAVFCYRPDEENLDLLATATLRLPTESDPSTGCRRAIAGPAGACRC